MLRVFTRAGQRERLAGQRCSRDPDRVERVVLAGQPPLRSWCAADLEHGFTPLAQETGQACAVAAASLDRPGATARRVPLSNPKQLAIATPVRVRRRPGHHATRGRGHNRHHVLVAVGIDAEHVVQLVCKHQTRSSDSLVGSGGAGLKRGKPRRQVGKESRPQGGQAPDQASSGRQTGAAAHRRTVHSKGTHKAAKPLTSHTPHGDNQPGWRPRQTPSSSLTDP